MIDPALTDETGSCGYGLTVIGFDRKLNFYTLESRQRLVLPSRAREIIGKMLLDYQPNRVICESAGGDSALIAWLGAFIERNKLDTVWQSFSALQDEVRGKRAKHQRIRAMETFVNDRKCWFRVGDDPTAGEQYEGYTYDLLRQIDQWPSLTVNDAIDSWSMGRYALPYVPTDAADYEIDEPTTNPRSGTTRGLTGAGGSTACRPSASRRFLWVRRLAPTRRAGSKPSSLEPRQGPIGRAPEPPNICAVARRANL